MIKKLFLTDINDDIKKPKTYYNSETLFYCTDLSDDLTKYQSNNLKLNIITKLNTIHFHDLKLAEIVNLSIIKYTNLLYNHMFTGNKNIFINTIKECLRTYISKNFYNHIFYESFYNSGGIIIIAGSSDFKKKIEKLFSPMKIKYFIVSEFANDDLSTIEVVNDPSSLSTIQFTNIETYLSNLNLLPDVSKLKSERNNHKKENIGLIVNSNLKTCKSSADFLIDYLNTQSITASVFHSCPPGKEEKLTNNLVAQSYVNPIKIVDDISEDEDYFFRHTEIANKHPLLNYICHNIASRKTIKKIFAELSYISYAMEFCENNSIKSAILIPGRGTRQTAFAETFKQYRIKSISFQNAFFGPYYTYTPQIGDIALLSDNVSYNYQKRCKYYEPEPYAELVGNPRYDLHASDEEPVYSISKPFKFIIIGQLDMDVSFLRIVKDLKYYLEMNSIDNYSILFKPHPRAKDNDVNNFISKNNVMDQVKLCKDMNEITKSNVIFLGIASNYILETLHAKFIVIPITYVPGAVTDFATLGSKNVVNSPEEFNLLLRMLTTNEKLQILRHDMREFLNSSYKLNNRVEALERIKAHL